MTRLRRIVAVNVPHHLTQRGNARQYILNRVEDRAVYLKLLRRLQKDLRWRLGMLMAVRRILERHRRRKWARMAGAVLFMSSR
jgi:hypothetical protein